MDSSCSSAAPTRLRRGPSSWRAVTATAASLVLFLGLALGAQQAGAAEVEDPSGVDVSVEITPLAPTPGPTDPPIDPSPDPDLASTGGSLDAAPFVLAAALILVGFGLVAVVRRRRSSPPDHN